MVYRNIYIMLLTFVLLPIPWQNDHNAFFYFSASLFFPSFRQSLPHDSSFFSVLSFSVPRVCFSTQTHGFDKWKTREEEKHKLALLPVSFTTARWLPASGILDLRNSRGQGRERESCVSNVWRRRVWEVHRVIFWLWWAIVAGRGMPATCVKSNRRYFSLRNEEGVVLRMWAGLQRVFIRVEGLGSFILLR